MPKTEDQLLRAGLEALTVRENRLLELVVLGYTNEAIGQRMNYDPQRISGMLSGLYGTLGLQGKPGINLRVVATNIYLRVKLRENCTCSVG